MNTEDRVDRTAFAVETSHEAAAEADRRFWWACTPEDRRRAVMLLRLRNYGDDASARLQRVLEVAQRAPG